MAVYKFLWVLAGVQMRFENVVIGEGVKIAQVRAVPELGSVFGEQKVFSRIELEKVALPQEALGGALFGALHGTRFFPRRVVATEVNLAGRIALPTLNADVTIGSDGKLAEAKLSGERLTGLVAPRGGGVMFEVTVGSFALPFLNKFTLTEFGAKGTADREGITVSEFDGRVIDGLYKLTIAYDGTGYGGWQLQPNAVTVQQRIEEALRKVLGSRFAVTVRDARMPGSMRGHRWQAVRWPPITGHPSCSGR